MKKVFYAFASLLSLAAFAGCEKKGADDVEHNASFRLVLLDAVGTSASVAVSSTGTEADTWYCFCSSDLNASAADLVSSEVAKLGGNASSVLKSGNKSVSFQNLTPNTDYKAVVTGLLADGTVYGTPVELKFNSGKEFGALQKNDNWKVGFSRGMFSQENLTVADFVTVEVAPEAIGKDKFFTILVAASQAPDIKDNDAVNEFLDACIEEMKAVLKEYGRSWSDVLVDKSLADPYNLVSEGDYYAFAIGADTKGRKTGLWNCSEKITAQKVEGSADFMKYEGVWTYQYEAEGGPQKVDFTLIPVLPDTNPDSNGDGVYVVRGWQGLDQEGKPIFQDFTAIYKNKKLLFMAYDMELPGTYGGQQGSWGTYGMNLKEEKVVQGAACAELVLNGDSEASLNGLNVELKDGISFKVDAFVIGIALSTGPTIFSGYPSLPCSVTKKANAPAASVSMMLSNRAVLRPAVSSDSMAVNMKFMK